MPTADSQMNTIGHRDRPFKKTLLAWVIRSERALLMLLPSAPPLLLRLLKATARTIVAPSLYNLHHRFISVSVAFHTTNPNKAA